jgi:hypothetical protein
MDRRPPSGAREIDMLTLIDRRSAMALALGWVEASRSRADHGEHIILTLICAWDALTELIGDRSWAPGSQLWPEIREEDAPPPDDPAGTTPPRSHPTSQHPPPDACPPSSTPP